jgi:hypothetical protein
MVSERPNFFAIFLILGVLELVKEILEPIERFGWHYVWQFYNYVAV